MGRQRAAEPQSQARAEGRGVPVPVISLGLTCRNQKHHSLSSWSWGAGECLGSPVQQWMAWGQKLGGGSGGPSPGLASLATDFLCHGLDVGMVTPACWK